VSKGWSVILSGAVFQAQRRISRFPKSSERKSMLKKDEDSETNYVGTVTPGCPVERSST
jgi:hypothetical protein